MTSNTLTRVGPDHYRYYDTIGPGGVTVRRETWVAYAETEKCWYLLKEHNFNAFSGRHEEWIKRARKRVLKHQYPGGKAHAHSDAGAAFYSYKKRKEWQMRHATLALERAKAVIGYFGDARITQEAPTEPARIECEHVQQMGWEDPDDL